MFKKESRIKIILYAIPLKCNKEKDTEDFIKTFPFTLQLYSLNILRRSKKKTK